jgi:hypothetical protein
VTTTSPAVSADPISVAVRAIHAMADGDRADLESLYHPRAVDRDDLAQPPSSRVPGPAGVYSTALWLRAAEVLVAEITVRERGLGGDLAGQGALIQRDVHDEADAMLEASGQQLIFGWRGTNSGMAALAASFLTLS